MRKNTGVDAGFVIRPALVITMVYIALCSFWFLWILCTAEAAPVGGTEVNRLISNSHYGWLSAGNVLFAALAVGDALRARGAPPGLSRQHAVGMFLTVVTLALVQLAGFYANAGPAGL